MEGRAGRTVGTLLGSRGRGQNGSHVTWSQRSHASGNMIELPNLAPFFLKSFLFIVFFFFFFQSRCFCPCVCLLSKTRVALSGKSKTLDDVTLTQSRDGACVSIPRRKIFHRAKCRYPRQKGNNNNNQHTVICINSRSVNGVCTWQQTFHVTSVSRKHTTHE